MLGIDRNVKFIYKGFNLVMKISKNVIKKIKKERVK